jgi:hypothetical protein
VTATHPMTVTATQPMTETVTKTATQTHHPDRATWTGEA